MRKSLSLNQVDLNLLNVFHLLMQERSVTRAAVRAGRTQSAVSHALRRLRRIFDDELFVKRGQTMEPTAQAHELSTVVSRALEDIQNAVDRHLRFNPHDSQRHFQVMVSDYTEALYMPALIEELARQAPQCSLSAIPIRGNDINDLMRRPELDCAVLGNPEISGGHLNSTVLARHRMVCAGWAGNRLLDELTLENYLTLPHLQISATGSNRGVSDIALAELDLSRHVAATISHYIVAPRVLKGTNMITAFADGMLLLMDDSSQTRITTPPINLPDVQISLIHAPSKQADAGHIWLRSCIRNVVRLVEERRFEAIGSRH